MRAFFDTATPFIILLFTVFSSIFAWLYRLIEKRIDSSVEEIKNLEVELNRFKDLNNSNRETIVKLQAQVEMIKDNQEKGFLNIEKLIVEKIGNLEKLFTEKLKNKT